jgi:hypothetical protein
MATNVVIRVFCIPVDSGRSGSVGRLERYRVDPIRRVHHHAIDERRIHRDDDVIRRDDATAADTDSRFTLLS